ncbi:MAG: zinc-ribbon domain containing protein [Patescibacteria group bacterium]|jgi:hypothetical protein
MQCKNCQSIFTIYPEDQKFYAKIGVPEPTSCPDCRQQNRLAWRNERFLYKRKCDLCQKDIISFYSPDKPYIQYCPECWWSDKWETPALDYDPNRPFFEQWAELLRQTPHLALIISHGENSDYCPHSVYYKNCYLCVSGVTGENIFYSYWVNNSFECLDCSLCFDLQQCYECLYCRNLFSSYYCLDCENSSELAFCRDCVSCHNCLGCVGLRHQEYQIFNQKVSSEEYQRQLAEVKANPQLFAKKFREFSLKFPCLFADIQHSENSTGDRLTSCKNSHNCFDAENLEDCAYIWNLPQGASACQDINYSPKAEMSYDAMSIVNSKYILNSVSCWDCSFVSYSWQCFYGQNLFGCIGLKHGNYQILNKKYSEEEYNQLKKKIIDDMVAQGIYGKLFSIEYSPFAYNETSAAEHFPLTKEGILRRGWSWQDNLPGTFGQGTVGNQHLTLVDIDEKILNAVFTCSLCQKNYKLIKPELKFYRLHGLILPHHCHDCRYALRMKLRNPHRLWHRQCMCENAEHNHQERCQNEFETTYSPDRPEKVYCEECYRKEIY